MKPAPARVIIEEYRAWFETSIARNPSPTGEQTKLIETTKAAFVALLNDAKEEDSGARQHLIDRGKELARARVYVIPRQELLIEAHEAIADMRGWAVPAKTISQLTVEVVPLIEDDEITARGALRSLFETYDYWETYVSNHERAMRFYTWVMLGVMLIALSGGVIMLHMAHVYSGIFCAGVAGGILSIMSRMPKVMSVGDTYAYQLRILSRLGVGAVASFMGMGLLAADIITVKIQQAPIADILNGKTVTTSPGNEVGMGSGSGSGAGSGSGSASGSADNAAGSAAGSNATPTVPSDAGLAVAPDAGLTPAPAPTVASGSAATVAADNVDTSKHEKPKKRLPQSNVLILMALAMLFAFSERALASFENAVLPSRTVTTKKRTSSPGQTPATENADADAEKQAGQAVTQGKPPETPAAPANTVTTTTTTTTDG